MTAVRMSSVCAGVSFAENEAYDFHVFTTPRFSATKTRPSGANETTVGLRRFVTTAWSTKPDGRVSAARATNTVDGIPGTTPRSEAVASAIAATARPARPPTVRRGTWSRRASTAEPHRRAGRRNLRLPPSRYSPSTVGLAVPARSTPSNALAGRRRRRPAASTAPPSRATSPDRHEPHLDERGGRWPHSIERRGDAAARRGPRPERGGCRGMALFVRQARLHPTRGESASPVDIRVDGDGISSVRPSGELRPSGDDLVLEADGRLVSPPLVDPHVHLDAVLTVGEPRYNESGTLLEGIQTWAERKPSLTIDDVKDRARQAILWEVAQGTGLIRSHVDVCDPSLTALRALLELRDEVADIVDLRLIAFPQDGILRYPGGADLMREAVRLGVDVIGGIPHYELTRDEGVESVHFMFDLARETGLPIDLHCDETDDEQSRFLEVVAARAIRDGMQGRVVAGHTTAMGSYNDAYAFKLIGILQQAGVTIVANPLDNVVLQGRFDTYPKRRGMTRVKELDAAGVNVSCGHDSIMDPWYPLGRGSMLDALSMLVHVAQMSGRTELFRAYEMVTMNPARAAGIDWGVKEGGTASFVVFDCADEAEAIRLRPAARWVVRNGRVVAETEPARSLVHVDGQAQPVAFTPAAGVAV